MLDVLIKVASNNTYLAKFHEDIDNTIEPIEQIYRIYNFGKDLEHIIHEEFNPWIYVANYPETLYQFWSNCTESLNEIFVTYVYITYGWLNNLKRNFGGLTLYTAYNILKPKIIIHFTGNLQNSMFDQFLSSKSHVDIIINEIIIHYSYYEIYVDEEIWSNKHFHTIHKNLLNYCSINIFNGDYPKIYKTIIKIPISKKIDNNINNDIFGSKDINHENYTIIHFEKKIIL